MVTTELSHLLKKLRVSSPKNIRTVVKVIDEAISDLMPLVCCVLEIYSERTIYLTCSKDGTTRAEVSVLCGLESRDADRWVVLNSGHVDDMKEKDDQQAKDVRRIELKTGFEQYGVLNLILPAGTSVSCRFLEDAGEVISISLNPFINAGSDERRTTESLKIDLLESSRDESSMKNVLVRMMEIAGAEFCAYYSSNGEECLHALLDSRELSLRVPEIREKLKTTYDMFANNRVPQSLAREKVYYKSIHNNISYLVGNSRIESYFIVPVIFDTKVRGVLFFGSVREDAFVRETISFFNSMAGEGKSGTPMMYMLSGELNVIGKIIGQIPVACAMISPEGRLVAANDNFFKVLGIDGAAPETLGELDGITPFNINGIWSEFRIAGLLKSRKIKADKGKNGYLSVDWVKLENVYAEAGSIILIRDVSIEKEKDRSTEEMLATVAHELRTPLTGLKNSLRLLSDSYEGESDADRYKGQPVSQREKKFVGTAIRTVDRLNLLVDGLVRTSSIRKTNRQAIFRNVPADRFIEDSITIFRSSFNSRKIELDLDISSEINSLYIDPDMMEQVIQNIISNSLKHVPYEGRIGIVVRMNEDPAESLRPEAIREHIPSMKFVTVRIEDSGPGLPDGVVERVNRAEKYDNNNTHPVRGLGLMIASRLVKLHGGILSAREVQGNGGTLDITIPADRKTNEAVLAVANARAVFDDTILRGDLPILSVLVNDNRNCWVDMISEWEVSPTINPAAEEVGTDDICIWPVSENLALMLFSEKSSLTVDRKRESVHGRLSLVCNKDNCCFGTAAYPEDGRKFADILERSVEMAAPVMVTSLWKGE
ncbi:MAG: GAF domain-containing sensor histidine kinase [Bacteroidales bacterium]|nr:GAF domain-containing sensor histidine kinase [Candidatus Latescibacterota bacterium]